MTTAYVGLGSNLGDAPGYVREGLAGLSRLGKLSGNSDLYRTLPWRGAGHPHYYNAVARVDTGLDVRQFLARLREIEERYGRTRSGSATPRTLELDLLLFDELRSDQKALTLPHPRLRERAFALVPLAAIAPEVRIPPDGQTARQLVAQLPPAELEGVVRIPNTAALRQPRRLNYDEPQGAACRYDELRPLSLFALDIFDAAASVLSLEPKLDVLDVGCGTGRYTRLLAARGASVAGLDASAAMLLAARAQGTPSEGSIEYRQGDANAALPAGPFGAVTFFFSIHHLTLGERFWKSLRAALAPQGRAAIATFPHRHLIENAAASFFPSLAAVDLPRFPSIPSLANMLRCYGFDEVRAHDVAREEVSTGDEFVAQIEGRYISSLHLIDDAEFETGAAAVRAKYAGRPHLRRLIQGTVVSARRSSQRPK